MRINSLFVQNFLGVNKAELALPQAVHLFAGQNGAGKSSLRDAIALALTADLGRVSQKKDAAQLIRAGADSACAEVIDADGEAFTVTLTAAGKITDSQKGKETDAALPFVLDAQRFAQLGDAERRAMLLALTGTKIDGASVKERLAKRGCDASKVERIAPLLRAGMDAASKDAKAKATEAKGAWRAITGETYGSEKAKTWKATVPAYDAEAARFAGKKLEAADLALASWQQSAGRLEAERQRVDGMRAKLPALQEHAGRLDRIETKLGLDKQGLADAEQALAQATAAAGAGPRVGLVHDLALSIDALLREFGSAGYGGETEVHDTARVNLAAYEAEHGPLEATAGDPNAAARLPELRAARDLMASAVSNGQRDQLAALQAKDEAEKIAQELADFVAADNGGTSLEQCRDEIAKLTKERAAVIAEVDRHKAAKAAADAAEKKTADAAKHAADVAAWDAIGDALSPDGIPAEILAESLGPINERLAQSAADTEWPRVEIGADMSITAAQLGRPYRLMSESEQWRCDAMLAEAIAHLSGVRLLVLDRFDVLDLKGRGELLGWLDVLAANGEIDSALVFGTLKALPADLPATIGAHWVEGGVVGDMRAAA